MRCQIAPLPRQCRLHFRQLLQITLQASGLALQLYQLAPRPAVG
jgi:hypothetical protein